MSIDSEWTAWEDGYFCADFYIAEYGFQKAREKANHMKPGPYKNGFKAFLEEQEKMNEH